MDIFRIQQKFGIAIIHKDADLSRDQLQPLFQFGFFYSPIVLISNIEEPATYEISAQPNQLDNAWLVAALNRFEPGWFEENGCVYSPMPSVVSYATVLSTLKTAISEPVAA